MTQSRNKREGYYAGKRNNKHWRTATKLMPGDIASYAALMRFLVVKNIMVPI